MKELAQQSNKLYIKNMVCPRCIKDVKHVLDEQHIQYSTVCLGEAELLDETPLEPIVFIFLKSKLSALGFELLENK
jgi:AraC family transcriptional regulator